MTTEPQGFITRKADYPGELVAIMADCRKAARSDNVPEYREIVLHFYRTVRESLRDFGIDEAWEKRPHRAIKTEDGRIIKHPNGPDKYDVGEWYGIIMDHLHKAEQFQRRRIRGFVQPPPTTTNNGT